MKDTSPGFRNSVHRRHGGQSRACRRTRTHVYNAKGDTEYEIWNSAAAILGQYYCIARQLATGIRGGIEFTMGDSA